MPIRAAIRDVIVIPPYHRRLGKIDVTATWVRHAFGAHKRQYGLLATQPDPAAPLAIWIHGGGWQFGSPELLKAFGDYFYRRGYHVWMPSHRRLPLYRGCDMLDDLTAGVRAVERVLGRTTPTPTLVAGMSSGGQLATLMALQAKLWDDTSLNVEGLLACGAPLSLANIGATLVRRRVAGPADSQRWCDADAYHQLTEAQRFPALLLHGTRDGLVPIAGPRAFATKARPSSQRSARSRSSPTPSAK